MSQSRQHTGEGRIRRLYKVPKLLATDTSIVFLDKSNRFLPLRHPFWVLDTSLNEKLDQEFKRNPKGYSKVFPLYWWVQGYREWTFVSGFACDPEEHSLHFNLVRLRAVSQWGPGQRVPTSFPEGNAQLLLRNCEALRKHLSESLPLDGVRERSQSPFTHEYTSSQPQKPASGAYRAYGYVFVVFFAALMALIILVVLSGLGLPLWIAVPLVLAGCFMAVRSLRRWGKRRAQRGG